jgi:antitoxin component YwqK of YwqJK toxin-antitoxin module
MKNSFILLFWVMGTLSVSGQNQLDEQGRKTGPWRVEYPNGSTLYEATFHEGRPVGLMTRYYDNNVIRAKMVFHADEDRSTAEMFYKSGKKAAIGMYVGQLKDSVWTYYSEYDGTVRIRESYQLGKLQGKAFRYYYTGGVSEEVHWEQNSREGPWNQYFEDGSIRLKGFYKNNMLNGPYEVYFSNNTLMMSGTYLDDQSNGTWNYYDDTGNLLYTLDYEKGSPADQEKYMKIMQDTLLKYDTILVPEPVQLF